MAKRVKAARPRGRNPLDLEAIGLVLLALGVFVLGVLVPALPTGRFGFELRQTLLGRVGWGAYALPVPPLVLGLLFLFRRSPRWWPRALLGYIVLAAGLWGVLMIVAPPLSGRWGVSLRAGLTGAWGTLAVIPAAFVASLGFELLVGLTPTRLTRSLIRALVKGTRALLAWMLETRRVARDRAAFHADVALARRALGELDRDLQALRTLYPGSAELERWRSEVRATGRRLSKPTAARLRDAQADLKAWQGAVRDFARDRAGEMVSVLKAEVARAPDQEASDLDGWARGLRRVLDDVLAQTSAAAQATDRVRNAMALDLAALIDRYRRLTRERDLDERALKRMTPRQLAQASQDHGKRLEGYRAIENDARTLDAATGALEGFRPLLGVLDRLRSEHPTFPELMEFDASLAAELSEKGRTVFEKVGGWTEALEAVEDRALVAARDAETAQRARQAADAARAAEAVAEEDLDASSERVGSDDGAASLQRELPPLRIGGQGTSGSGGMDAALEAALLDDAVVSLSGRATALVEAAPDAGGSAGSPGSSVPWGQDRSPARAPDDGSDADLSEDAEDADDESGSARAGDVPEYGGIPIQVPPMSLLDVRENGSAEVDRVELEQEHRDRVRKIDETLASFKLDGRVVAAVRGPTVTRFEVEPAPGEKIARFANLSDDLALAMAVGSVRIEAPIPGKSVIGLEVPNATRDLVRFREAAESGSFRRAKARLPIILGKSIDGDMVVGDLVKMPHLLIAGSTGSGKSVAVNTLVGSLLYRFLPTELRLLMIDPKMVELTPYDGVPHLIRPVVTNPTDAAGVLLGAVKHMERRYKMMSKVGAKNLDQYNEKARNLDLPEMPFIALIIDELADLMITTPKEVESAIMRLAQMARATGMHLVLATQRPSVDILTSLIKVNVPARMAFAVSSSHDSRTILDSMGAERLIGMGDMLFYQPGLVKAVRLQGPFISESEIATISDFLRRQYFDDEFVEAFGSDFEPVSSFESDASGLIDWNDDKLRVAAELVINEGQASVSRLQRRLSVGHARAGKLMDSLEALGVVGPHQGSKPRDVLVPYEELPNIFGK